MNGHKLVRNLGMALVIPGDVKNKKDLMSSCDESKVKLRLLRIQASCTVIRKIGLVKVLFSLQRYRLKENFGSLRSLYIFQHKFGTIEFALFTKCLTLMSNLRMLSLSVAARYKYPENIFPTVYVTLRDMKNNPFDLIFQDLYSKYIKTLDYDRVFYVAAKMAAECKNQFTSFTTRHDLHLKKSVRYFYQASEYSNRRKKYRLKFALGNDFAAHMKLNTFWNEKSGAEVVASPSV